VVSIVGSDRATETSLRVHLEGAAVEHHRICLEDLIRDKAPFDTPSDLAILAREQGVGLVTDLKKLAGGFWPEDESTDDLLRSLRAWRDERPGGNRG